MQLMIVIVGEKKIEKRGRLKEKPTSSPTIVRSQEALPQLKRPLTRDKSCGVSEVNDTQLVEKIPLPQLLDQPLPIYPATKLNFVDKPTREEVEARARAYTISFEVDTSKIPQPPKDVSIPRIYYLLSENMSSVIMDRAVLHDPEKCIETLRVMEQDKNLESAMKSVYFDWSVHDRKFVSPM